MIQYDKRASGSLYGCLMLAVLFVALIGYWNYSVWESSQGSLRHSQSVPTCDCIDGGL